MKTRRISGKREELANTISHAVGIILGLGCAYILMSKALSINNIWAVISVIIYILGVLFCYVSSTLYHGFKTGKKKDMFRKLDHTAIYFHIAGTYTPITLITLREEGAWGWSLFVVVWLATLIGTYISFSRMSEHSNLKTFCYIVMGSSFLVALKPLIRVLNDTNRIDVLYWIIAGGVAYIIGALFYSWTSKKYMHTVFHIFVLIGTICHATAIYKIM